MSVASAFTVSIDGEVVSVDPSDFDRKEWRALKDELGLSQVAIIAAVAQMDLDAVAGLVWLHRRREEPDLEYDDVSLRLADLDTEDDPAPPD